MFTGIVEEVGLVRQITTDKLVIASSFVLSDAKVGGSIAVNGTCLTMTAVDVDSFSVDVVPETWRRTNLGGLTSGGRVNLERPLAAQGRLDGHILQGHVDGTATITKIRQDGTAKVLSFTIDSSLTRYIVDKGFVAVDGVSLTVVHSLHDGFTVTIIPFTNEHTVFNERNVGDKVNIEVDVLAKYVERLIQTTEHKERD